MAASSRPNPSSVRRTRVGDENAAALIEAPIVLLKDARSHVAEKVLMSFHQLR
jgi:hypothetical protein